MDTQHTELARLGWDQWFADRADAGGAGSLARVAAVDRDLLLLMDAGGSFRGKLAGSYLHRHAQPQELPCVGDWVRVEKSPTEDLGLVQSRLERRTALRRKVAGDSVDFQMIAANVDSVIIVQSCHFDFNLRRLERYLVMIREGGAEPCVLLTKTDLVEPEVLAAQQAEIRAAGVTAPLLCLSNVTGEGLEPLRKTLQAARTYCFVGSSGVGKSTLINQLIGHEALLTRGVSATGEGRHTTVRRELVVIEGGALVIDNPGMREFGLLGAESGIAERFSDVVELTPACRFRNCTHASEPGCAVREALEAGALSASHVEHYRKLKDESEFHQLSYAEKRKKDRDFGKFLKTAKKDLGK
ncbi:MAG: ribosome small subunit-dependent GTPase A [Candidatus Delongbacteria bacterium]